MGLEVFNFPFSCGLLLLHPLDAPGQSCLGLTGAQPGRLIKRVAMLDASNQVLNPFASYRATGANVTSEL